MTFQIQPLPAEQFAYLSGLSDSELEVRNIQILISDGEFPCRVSLTDVAEGDRVFLLHFEHQPNETPYRASHAIFVKEDAVEDYPKPDSIPVSIASRLLSVRAFDAAHQMIDAEVIEGAEVGDLISRFMGNPATDYIHLHYARRGCFAAKVARA